MTSLQTPRTRAQLISLLTDACELEHGLACSYLYTAFSLKQRPTDDGLTAEQAHKTRYWASQIFFVASEEMLHLAQAWNLLTAIGGTPYCLRPNLPQGSRYYPLHARIELEPFGDAALRRFITYETPARATVPWIVKQAALSKPEIERGHVTIGELYATIADGFSAIPDLFIGDWANQVDRSSVQFTNLVPVRDTASALQAIHMITQQGEGLIEDRRDCHYGVFLRILEELTAAHTKWGRRFQPARSVMKNPVADSTRGYGALAHPIKDPLTRQTAELFDAVYFLMLQLLAFAFTPAAYALQGARMAQAAIELMAAVVRPLGDALTTLPSGVGRLNAGPAFGLTRFISMPADPRQGGDLARTRLAELSADAERLAAELPLAPQLGVVAARLRDISGRVSG